MKVSELLLDEHVVDVEVVRLGCRWNINRIIYKTDKVLRRYVKDIVELEIRIASKFPMEWKTNPDGTKEMTKWRYTVYV